MEKESLECIRRLLEIAEEECNHELLLSMKKLRELGSSPFPYIVPIIPRPLPVELVRGEHFTLVDLLKSIPSSSAQAGSAQKPQVEIVERALVSFVRPDQLSLAKQDSQPTPQATKKKRKKEKKVGQIKVAGTGLEVFMD